MTYPVGTPSSGVTDVFAGTSFTPSDVVAGIRDNHSAVNQNTMLRTLGYQVSLVQNFVNATYLGREATPVGNAYFVSGNFSEYVSSASGESKGNYYQGIMTPDYIQILESAYYSGSKYININNERIISYDTLTGGGQQFLLNQTGIWFGGAGAQHFSTDESFGGLTVAALRAQKDNLLIQNDADPAFFIGSGFVTVSGWHVYLENEGGSQLYLRDNDIFMDVGGTISGAAASMRFDGGDSIYMNAASVYLCGQVYRIKVGTSNILFDKHTVPGNNQYIFKDMIWGTSAPATTSGTLWVSGGYVCIAT